MILIMNKYAHTHGPVLGKPCHVGSIDNHKLNPNSLEINLGLTNISPGPGFEPVASASQFSMIIIQPQVALGPVVRNPKSCCTTYWAK